MKKTVRIIALAMVALMLSLALVSCGKTLSGEYVNDATVLSSGVVTTYAFSGSKVNVTIETKVLGNVTGTVELEGKYAIDGDKINFTFEGEDAESYNGKVDFEELENGDIKIGILTFAKA